MSHLTDVIYSKRAFRVPASFYDRVHVDYHCDDCIAVPYALEHPHQLHVIARSLEEAQAVKARILSISQPWQHNQIKQCYTGWAATYRYHTISLGLAEYLHTLECHYSLRDLIADQYSLRHTPRYSEGVTGALTRLFQRGEEP